jgi:hypothetical protein
MIKKGTIFTLSDDSNEQSRHLVLERKDDIGQGEGGWVCISLDIFLTKGVSNITPFDCWRITDKYLEIQMKKGVIKLIETL